MKSQKKPQPTLKSKTTTPQNARSVAPNRSTFKSISAPPKVEDDEEKIKKLKAEVSFLLRNLGESSSSGEKTKTAEAPKIHELQSMIASMQNTIAELNFIKEVHEKELLESERQVNHIDMATSL
jgi:hypothetical protein